MRKQPIKIQRWMPPVPGDDRATVRYPLMKDHVILRIVALLLVLVLGGCLGRTPPPKFYLLTPLDAPQASVSSEAAGLAVGVGPVTIPDYLKRPQIVTRASCGTDDFCGELQLAELDRWAEPLEDNIVRVLSENLSVLLPSERTVRYPWRPAASLDFKVAVDVVRFNVDDRGRSVLTARWTVVGGEKDEVLLLRKSSFGETGVSDGYGGTVAALSRTLAQLSREIADAVKSLAQGADT